MEQNRFVACFRFILIKLYAVPVGLSVGLLILSSCAEHPCREPKNPELDRTQSYREKINRGAEIKPSITTESNENGELQVGLPNAPKIIVYKPDGSRQCEKGTGVSLKTMAGELAGIKIYRQDKIKDGLAHIQVCGSPTGMINTFEVDLGNLNQAEERGFKKWEASR